MNTINTYHVYLTTGEMLTLCASNLEGANAQIRTISNFVVRIERIYKTGKRAGCIR